MNSIIDIFSSSEIENKYPNYIILDSNNEDILSNIDRCKNNNDTILLKVSSNINKKIVYSSSYNAKNLLVIYVDLLLPFQELSWVLKILNLTEKCGLYTIIIFNNIIPTITTTTDVLKIIDGIYPNIQCEYVVNFPRYEIEEVNEEIDYYTFYGTKISNKYFTKIDYNVIECSNLYKTEFSNIILLYTQIKKIQITFKDTYK